MYETHYGPKYDEKLDAATISSNIRRDIKEALKAGELPAGKYSVRLERYSGGRSITISVSNVAIDLFEPRYLRHELVAENQEYYPVYQRYTKERQQLIKKLEELGNAYNYDGSDIQTDYFHVNYYLRVGFDWRFEEAKKQEELARVRIDLANQENERTEQKRAALEHELTRELSPRENPIQVSMSRRQASASVRLGLSAALDTLRTPRNAPPSPRCLWMLG